MAGLSNHGQTKREPYVTAGDRAYLIGTQDGDFPDMGGHVPGEMGGLWAHPIKLIDGFWADLTDAATGQAAALADAVEFVNYPYGNRFRYGPVLDSLEIERLQFSPDSREGVIVQYTFKNAAHRRRELQFRFAVKTDLLPVWFSDRLGITDAPDSVTWQATTRRFIARDAAHPWFAVWGAADARAAQPVAAPASIHTKGQGVAAAAQYQLAIDPHGTATLTFVIAGSATDQAAALRTYDDLAQNHASLLASKKAHYASVIGRARIRIPDRQLQEVYNWVRVNTEWLVRDVPGIGRGVGGGFMEYPWWFGTETYTLQALAATGDFDLAEQTLRLLQRQSMKTNGNGRIVHEVTTNGVVSNPGNTQETAQFILTVGKVFEWTGDRAFAREMYPEMKAGITWLLTDMDQNKDLFPEGYGIMEVYGLNAELIDVAVYTQQALEATARVAAVIDGPDTAARYRDLAAQLKTKINERFWIDEQGTYADFFGSRAQAISAADGAIHQIRLRGDRLTPKDSGVIAYYERLQQQFAALPDTTRGWLTNKNWVITTPLETGIAPRARAIALLDKIRAEDVGEWGPYLSATERQAMMTIATGVQAVAEANYGRSDQALWYMDKIVRTFNRKTPGSIAEMMPDYGCFTIAWTSYGIVVPLIEGIFGIHPDAPAKTVVFEPHVPSGWEDMSIDALPIESNVVSFSRAKTKSGVEYDFAGAADDWTFVLQVPEVPGAKYYLNGKPVPFTVSGIRMQGRRNQVLVVE
jgi:glycogen debranching enzyme